MLDCNFGSGDKKNKWVKLEFRISHKIYPLDLDLIGSHCIVQHLLVSTRTYLSTYLPIHHNHNHPPAGRKYYDHSGYHGGRHLPYRRDTTYDTCDLPPHKSPAHITYGNRLSSRGHYHGGLVAAIP